MVIDYLSRCLECQLMTILLIVRIRENGRIWNVNGVSLCHVGFLSVMEMQCWCEWNEYVLYLKIIIIIIITDLCLYVLPVKS